MFLGRQLFSEGAPNFLVTYFKSGPLANTWQFDDDRPTDRWE